MKQDIKPILVRVDINLYHQILKTASKENRSLSNYVLTILAKELINKK